MFEREIFLKINDKFFENSYLISSPNRLPLKFFKRDFETYENISPVSHLSPSTKRFFNKCKLLERRYWRIVELEDEKFSFRLKFIFFMKISISFRLENRSSNSRDATSRIVSLGHSSSYIRPLFSPLTLGKKKNKKIYIYIFCLLFPYLLPSLKNFLVLAVYPYLHPSPRIFNT